MRKTHGMVFLSNLIIIITLTMPQSQNAGGSVSATGAADTSSVQFNIQPTDTISPFVIAGGGGKSAQGNFVLEGTIGQAATGTMVNGSFTLSGGFWNAVNTSVPVKKRPGQIITP